MSWGTQEFWGEWYYDSIFTTPAGHIPMTYVASSGDSGAWYGPMYPSVSPNVLAVGGTTLTLGSGNSYSSESGWSGSTGGFSGPDKASSSTKRTLVSGRRSGGGRLELRRTDDARRLIQRRPEHGCRGL